MLQKLNLVLLSLLLLFQASCDTTSENLSCKSKAFLLHQNSNPISVLNSADGEIIETLYPDEEGAGKTVNLVASENGWIEINFADKTGWIKAGKVAVATRNYNNETVNLYEEPKNDSEIVNSFTTEQIVTVQKCSGNWVYAETTSSKQKIKSGWLSPEMQCGNPYTTCP